MYFQWHYEAHYSTELERLNHIRVKKNTFDFPDRHSRRQVRDATLERIARRRTRRLIRNQSNAPITENPELINGNDLTCPVCNLPVTSDEYSNHVDHCLKNAEPNLEDQEDEVDVDSVDGLVETYTWAGHTRVRATSLVEGGLRGPGFVSITRSDEDQVLDIEGDGEDEDEKFGAAQYTESDLILPKPETDAEIEDLETRTNIQEALTGQKSTVASDLEANILEKSPKKTPEEFIKHLQEENSDLRTKTMCNICMDSYKTPLVSTVCWHVSCEECWMRALGTKKLCPQCKVIIQPKDLRRIYM